MNNWPTSRFLEHISFISWKLSDDCGQLSLFALFFKILFKYKNKV